MQDNIERKESPTQQPVVPPHGGRDVGTTEPVDVPQAAPSACPRCRDPLEWVNGHALDARCGMLWRWAPDQKTQHT